MATLRKVATVVLSYMFFPKDVQPIHVISFGLVVVGLIVSEFCRQKESKKTFINVLTCCTLTPMMTMRIVVLLTTMPRMGRRRRRKTTI